MPIRPYLDGQRFDAETTRLMGIAFETAIQALHNRGVLDPPREVIAGAIIDMAKRGERDPDRLCDAALKACQPAIVSRPQSSSASRFTAGASGFLNCARQTSVPIGIANRDAPVIVCLLLLLGVKGALLSFQFSD